MSFTSFFSLRFDHYAMELTSVYTPLKNTASLVRVVFNLSVFYFYMTPWYTFVVLLGTNLDRMKKVMMVGMEGCRFYFKQSLFQRTLVRNYLGNGQKKGSPRINY